MRMKWLVAALGGLVMSATSSVSIAAPAPVAPAPVARAGAEAVALWDADYSPQMTAADCERWRLDERGFCTADDARNGVELGLKFQASRTLVITGVRVYRVDPATITGSLWDGDGTLLATGTFAPTATTGWQDLTFARPVTIKAQHTYVTSYYSPATKYAFSYGFFDRQLVRGPVTALREAAGDPNGVHCYDVSRQCQSFPTLAYRDTAYWVTPIWQNPADEPVPPPATSAAPTDVTAPTVRTSSPRGGATRVRTGSRITITFSEAVRSSLLSSPNVRLLRKGGGRVPARLHYDTRRSRLTVVPVRRLRPRTTYRIVLAASIVDIAGNRLDQDPARGGAQQAILRFRTR